MLVILPQTGELPQTIEKPEDTAYYEGKSEENEARWREEAKKKLGAETPEDVANKLFAEKMKDKGIEPVSEDELKNRELAEKIHDLDPTMTIEQ